MFEIILKVLLGLTGEGFRHTMLTQTEHKVICIIGNSIQSDMTAYRDYNWARGHAVSWRRTADFVENRVILVLLRYKHSHR